MPAMNKSLSLIVLAIVLLFFTGSALPARAEMRLAVFPFAYAGAGPKPLWLSAAVADILSSRLYVPTQVFLVDQARIREALQKKKGALTEDTMRAVSAELGAQAFVAGSIDEQGETIVLTARLFPVEPFAPSGDFAATCKGREELIGKVGELANQMRSSLVGPSSDATAFGTEGSGGETRGLVWEDELTSTEQAGKGALSEGPSPVSEEVNTPVAPVPPPRKIWPCTWQSEPIPGRVRGVAVSDVDGDKGNELVLITEQEVLVVRKNTQGLEERGRYKEPGQCRFLRIDSGDINNNGVSELFVTSVREKPPLGAVADYRKEQEDELASLVIEWHDKGLKRIDGNLPWFLSLFSAGKEGLKLWGQEAGKDMPLAGPIVPLMWNGNKYVPSGDQGLPAGLNLLGMGILTREGKHAFLQLDFQGGLSLHGPEGEILGGADMTFGGSDLYVTLVGTRAEWKTETLPLPLRVLVRDLNQDGKEDILIGENVVRKTGILDRTPTIEKGAVFSLEWAGDKVEVLGSTGDREEGVADYCLADGDNDGKEELIVVLRPADSFFALHPKSYVAFHHVD